MLLELRQLSDSLRRAHVEVGRRDDHLVTYPNGKTLFKVTISETSEVRAVTTVDKSRVVELLKYEVSKGGAREATPGFNVPPLFEAETEQADAVTNEVKKLLSSVRKSNGETPETRRAALDAIITKCHSGWLKKEPAIRLCLTTAPAILLRSLEPATGEEIDRLSPLRELLRRVKQLTPESLYLGVLNAARNVIESWAVDTAQIEALIQLLFAKDGVLILELSQDSKTPANHTSVWEVVNRVLLRGSGQQVVTNFAVDDSTLQHDIFGEPCPPNTTKMPERRLPRLGNVKLRSHAASKPCQTRYGLNEGASCPVGLNARGPLADALAWLTASQREGQTYRDISNASGLNLPTLLLAYPDPLPSHPPALAAVLAKTGQAAPGSVEARFEAAAEVVVGQLGGLIAQTPAAKVNIFVLAKADTARTRLLVSRQFAAERIIQAAREWPMASRNIPPVFIKLFRDNKQSYWEQCHKTPYPSEVSRYLNRSWQRGGERSEQIAVFDFGSELILFLDTGRLLTETARRGLQLAVSQWVVLLLAMGQAAVLGRVFPFAQNEQLLLPPILGLLLAKLGQTKEMYMNDTPYWIGRLLGVADRMHKNYCDIERNRQYPPQLIGNGAMPTCLENPRAGLARLAERLPLYQRVAGEELRREVAEIERHLDHSNLPDRATDEHKAQILLGYLSRPDLVQTEPTNPS